MYTLQYYVRTKSGIHCVSPDLHLEVPGSYIRLEAENPKIYFVFSSVSYGKSRFNDTYTTPFPLPSSLLTNHPANRPSVPVVRDP